MVYSPLFRRFVPHSASLVIKPNFRHAAKDEGCVRFRVCVLAHGCLFNPTRHLQHGHFPFSPTSNPPPHSTFPILCSSSFSPTRKIDYRGVDDGFERDEVKIQREMRNFSNRMTIVSRLKGLEGWKLCPLFKLCYPSNNRSVKIDIGSSIGEKFWQERRTSWRTGSSCSNLLAERSATFLKY